MKIMTRLNLLSLLTILVMTAAVMAVGTLIIGDILYRFEERVLRLELTNASQAILRTLNRSGVRAAAENAAEQQAYLRQQKDFKTILLFVVEAPDNRVVYHPRLAAGARIDLAAVDQMFGQREGVIEYDFEGVAYYAAFTTVHPLNWLIGVAISRDEMLAQKFVFLRAIGGVTFLILCLNALLVNLFGRRLLRRIGAALDCVNRIEQGELSARIPAPALHDEVGRLQDGINAMSARIEQRTTAQQAAEAAVREREARIRRLIESNIIGIFFWDIDGSISDANDAFLAMVGYRRDDIAAGLLRWTRLTPPEYAALDAQAYAEIEASSSCRPYEKQFLCRDGGRIPVLVGGTLLEESTSQGVAFVLDLSERKQAEADRQALQAAEAASRAKSTFLSTMSHELRTPLNAILGYAQLLRHDATLSERQASGLATIVQSGQHLLLLINDLLDLAKIESGKFELAPAGVNLTSFLPVVADIVRIKAEEKGLLFAYQAPGDLPRNVLADEKRLRQVLLNLLGNAVKFTDRGQVSLGVRMLEHDDKMARLRFEIIDTGIGMAPEQLSTIFLPFEQAGNAQRRAGGTGLGLAISRQLLQMMGSEIRVESTPGSGSRFWFELSLPLAHAPAPAHPAPEPIRGYAGARRRLLVADDVVGNRALLTELLGGLGFELCEAVNGAEALAQVRTQHPDLVLMDLVMPVLDGMAAIRGIRATPGLEHLPIIAVSASADAAEYAASLTAGADAFLPKPYEEERLLACIGMLLSLTWIHAGQAPATPVATEDAAELVIPRQEEMRVLHQLALAGDMRAIQRHADHLRSLDTRYIPFAQTLQRMAQAYQSKALLALVTAHLRPATDNIDTAP